MPRLAPPPTFPPLSYHSHTPAYTNTGSHIQPIYISISIAHVYLDSDKRHSQHEYVSKCSFTVVSLHNGVRVGERFGGDGIPEMGTATATAAQWFIVVDLNCKILIKGKLMAAGHSEWPNYPMVSGGHCIL